MNASPVLAFVLLILGFAQTAARAGWLQRKDGVPTEREGFSIVWAGNKLILWGGVAGGGPANDGFLYDSVSDRWTPVNTDGAPSGRSAHSAVWTGSEMIIWGGKSGGPLNDGARYNPATNS